jgi:hypothetical protein
MKIISVILILLGLYIMFNDTPEEKPKRSKIENRHQKDKEIKIQRLVEIVDPNYDKKHPKKF